MTPELWWSDSGSGSKVMVVPIISIESEIHQSENRSVIFKVRLQTPWWCVGNFYLLLQSCSKLLDIKERNAQRIVVCFFLRRWVVSLSSNQSPARSSQVPHWNVTMEALFSIFDLQNQMSTSFFFFWYWSWMIDLMSVLYCCVVLLMDTSVFLRMWHWLSFTVNDPSKVGPTHGLKPTHGLIGLCRRSCCL